MVNGRLLIHWGFGYTDGIWHDCGSGLLVWSNSGVSGGFDAHIQKLICPIVVVFRSGCRFCWRFRRVCVVSSAGTEE
jgi:hypothetical protein